jgi:hypothetical protein
MPDLYHQAASATLLLLQVVLDQEAGLRNAAGDATPLRQRVYRDGVEVTGDPRYDPGTLFVMPSQHWPVIDGDDGSSVLKLPGDIPIIAQTLAKAAKGNVRGVAFPKLRDLVQVDSEKDYDKLPAGVMRVLDDAFLRARLTADLPDPQDPTKLKRQLLLAAADVDDPSKLDMVTRDNLLDVVGKLRGAVRVKAGIQRIKAKLAQDDLARVAGFGAAK